MFVARPTGRNLSGEVERLHAAGLSGAAIGRELGISRSTVAYHLRKLGHEPDSRFSRRYDWAAVQAFHNEGHTARECFLRFGISSQSWHAARKLGDLVKRPAGMAIEELLAAPRNREHLKRRLQAAELLPRHCEHCGLNEWRGKPLSLQLHHINGDKHDNRLENLEILCPNCHSQTDTWGGKNKGKRPLEVPGLSA